MLWALFDSLSEKRSPHSSLPVADVHYLDAMGGTCWLVKPNGRRGKGPPCTDNFQIVAFAYDGTTYHSVEQAFQSLKFRPGSSQRKHIAVSKPSQGESEGAYGMRMWQLGQSRHDPLCDSFEEIKVALMYVLNVAKYVSNPSMEAELIQGTDGFPIDGGASTWMWQKYNGLIHTLIREKIRSKADLKVEAMRDVTRVVEAQKVVAEMEALWDPKKLGVDSDDDD